MVKKFKFCSIKLIGFFKKNDFKVFSFVKYCRFTMTSIENAFKNQVYFNSISEEFDIFNNFIPKFLKYKTMLIRDPQYIGIDDIGDVSDKVEPFVVYLVSNYTTINTPLKVKCIECLLEIEIFPPDDENNYIGLIKTNGYINDGVVEFHEPDFVDHDGTYRDNPDNCYTEPVEISIEACFFFLWDRRGSTASTGRNGGGRRV